jgi:hypothetical protein
MRNQEFIYSCLFLPDTFMVFLCGHDHVPCSVYLPETRLIVNPGSVGLPAYTDDLPYFHAMETGTPHARYSIISSSRDKWRVEDVSIPYQWELAAKMAMQNDRPDWAKWLKTGRAYAVLGDQYLGGQAKFLLIGYISIIYALLTSCQTGASTPDSITYFCNLTLVPGERRHWQPRFFPRGGCRRTSVKKLSFAVLRGENLANAGRKPRRL